MDNSQGFDAVASYYDFLARLIFGNSIRNAQTYFLNRIPNQGRILVLGGGTGWWLKQILKDRPGISILYIDSSEKMIAKAKAHSNSNRRIEFRLATEESIVASDKFDAVITFFYLDLFDANKLSRVLEKIRSSIKPGGYLVVADFKDGLRWQRVMLSIMYCFFAMLTKLENNKLPDWKSQLTEADLTLLDHKLFYGQFIESGLYKAKCATTFPRDFSCLTKA